MGKFVVVNCHVFLVMMNGGGAFNYANTYKYHVSKFRDNSIKFIYNTCWIICSSSLVKRYIYIQNYFTVYYLLE